MTEARFVRYRAADPARCVHGLAFVGRTRIQMVYVTGAEPNVRVVARSLPKTEERYMTEIGDAHKAARKLRPIARRRKGGTKTARRLLQGV